MSFEPEFMELMTSSVTLKHQSSADLYNKPTMDSGIAVPAHITYRSKIVRGNTEENTISSAQLELPPPGFVWNGVTVPQVAFTDQFTLPDTTARRVLDVVVCFDESGTPHHQEIALT